MKTHIYFVRHGEVHNPAKIFYGRMPRFKLSENGLAMAARTGSFLKHFPVSHLYASPLLRARQTAAVLAGHMRHVPLSYSKLLLEIKSSNQGSVFDYTQGVVRDLYSPPVWKTGDEHMEDIRDRMLAFITRTARLFDGKHVVAVSHGDPLMIMRAAIEHKPMHIDTIRPAKSAYIAPGEVWKVTIDRGLMAIESLFRP